MHKHGFARNCLWQRGADVAENAARVCYFLDSASFTSTDWPHQFRLEYAVSVQASSLTMALTVINTDVQSWSFHAALHTYLRVKDIATTHISGLAGHTYHDKVKDAQVGIQTQPLLPVIGELDRIYVDVHSPLHVHDGQARLQITQDGEGFSDAVVWNPGAVKASAMPDLTRGAENRFVCVEAGAIMQAIELAPGAQWTGRQILRVQ
jgi:glucose-6-phosphate 1-epimerase